MIGVTIIDARFTLIPNGHVTITLPHEVRLDEEVLALALAEKRAAAAHQRSS